MKIGLVLDPFGVPTAKGSAGAFHFLVEALIKGSPNDQFVCYVKPELFDDAVRAFPRAEIRNLGPSPVSLLAGPRLDPALDAYLFMTPIVPLFFTPKRVTVIAQDFDYLERKPQKLIRRLKGMAVRILQAHALARADRIIAITESTKQQALRFFSIPTQKISVVPVAYRPPHEEPVPVDVGRPFFFFAGALKERKNVHGIITAFARFYKDYPTHSLVIAGKIGGPYYRSLLPLISAHKLEGAVRFLGFVGDRELSWLYRNAEAFVFPSLVEGFGMPVLEAMSVGTPVITSSTGALAEVAGSTALLADPSSPDQIADRMRELADTDSLRKELRIKGWERAALFTWEKTAAGIRSLI